MNIVRPIGEGSFLGTLVYFKSNDISTEIDRVEVAGEKVFQSKTLISPKHGYIGVFIYSKDKRIALHADA